MLLISHSEPARPPVPRSSQSMRGFRNASRVHSAGTQRIAVVAGGSEVIVKSIPRATNCSDGGSASHAKRGWSPRVFDHTSRYAAGCGACHSSVASRCLTLRCHAAKKPPSPSSSRTPRQLRGSLYEPPCA